VRARAPEALFVVDAISGFPAAPLEFEAWGVDAVVCGSQKAFMLPPGLSFFALGPRAIEAVRAPRPRRYYFDVRPYLDGPVPYTPAVSLYYALEKALDLLEREGAEARYRRHRTLMRIVRSGARAIGLEPLSADGVASPTVTALVPPTGVAPGAVKAAAAELGVLFGGGLGPLAERVFRIGHVGHLSPLDAVASVAAAELALARATGRQADGRGAQAAVAAWQAAVAEGASLHPAHAEVYPPNR
jgi:aspartate aminotransferase-like enzyme